jgi:two-component system sensor histidine kinase MprB
VKPSLRQRLILMTAAAVALAVVLAVLGSYAATREKLLSQVDETLAGQARTAQRLVGGRDAQRLLRRIRSERPRLGARLAGDVEVSVQLLGPEGEAQPLTPPGSATLPVTPADREIADTGEGRSFVDSDVEGEHLRVLTEGLGAGGAVQLGHSLEGVDEVLADLRLTLGLIAASGIAVAAILAWLIASRVIAPLRRLSEAAEHVTTTEDLSRRIDVVGDDEIARLTSRFNTMLGAIERSQGALGRSVDAQRRLVADASHELRTPIASLRTDIEVLAEHPELSPAARSQIVADTSRRIEELSALVADVIELARGEEPAGELEDVRFDLLVAEAVTRARGHAPKRTFKVSLEPCVVVGQAERLARAVNNLLDNACKYSRADEPIEVTLSRGELSVRDRGPGVAVEERDQIFDRFHRGSASRSHPGSGLGLAIVRQVAESCGGWVSVAEAPGGGADFRLHLPVERVEAG